jgi:hypothetical protein
MAQGRAADSTLKVTSHQAQVVPRRRWWGRSLAKTALLIATALGRAGMPGSSADNQR